MGQCFSSEQQISILREETTIDATKQQQRQKEKEQEQQKVYRRPTSVAGKNSTTTRSILKKKDVENLVSKSIFVNYMQIRYTIIRVCMSLNGN